MRHRVPFQLPRLVLPAILALALFAGCSDSSLSPEDRLPLYDLSVGNRWITRCSVFDTTGALQQTCSDSLLIVRDTVINGERWYLTNHDAFLANRSDGLWAAARTTPLSAVRSIKHPVNVGEVFRRDTVYYGSGHFDYRIYEYSLRGKGEQVTVAAGTFSAYRYGYLLTSSDRAVLPDEMYNYSRDEFWIAPTVGVVKSVDYERTASGRVYLKCLQEVVEVELN